MTASLLIIAIGFGAPAIKDPAKRDANIIGEWTAERSVHNGKESDEKSPTTWIFTKEGTFNIRENGKDAWKKPWLYCVNRDVEPMTIDLIAPNDDDPLRFRGILKFDGDNLTMCLADIEKPRPTEFASNAGTKQTLSVLKRVKPKD